RPASLREGRGRAARSRHGAARVRLRGGGATRPPAGQLGPAAGAMALRPGGHRRERAALPASEGRDGTGRRTRGDRDGARPGERHGRGRGGTAGMIEALARGAYRGTMTMTASAAAV